MQIRLEAGKDRKVCHSSSSYFTFRCEVRSKTWQRKQEYRRLERGQCIRGEGKANQGQVCRKAVHRIDNPVEAEGHYLKWY